MMRTFLHSFGPATANPITGATVDLEVSEIEDAGPITFTACQFHDVKA
jgi:hypothetical protein